MTERPDFIVHAPSVYAEPERILENREHIESLPMDGMAVHMFDTWASMRSDFGTSSEYIRGRLQPLKDFNEGMKNHLMLYTDRPGHLFDDAAWAKAADMWRIIAAEASDAGFEGIYFDNEEYFGKWQSFFYDFPDASPEEFEAYRDKAIERGREMMSAITETFPDADVGVFFGPWRSLDGDPQSGQELLGPFFTGMLEAMGPGMTMSDMGELYSLRTEEDFARSAEARGDALAQEIDWAISDEMRADYDDIVAQDFMVYTAPPQNLTPMDPDILVDTLVNAFHAAESSVMLYSDVEMHDWFPSEDTPLDWFRPGAVSREWWDAVERALEIVEGGGHMPEPRSDISVAFGPNEYVEVELPEPTRATTVTLSDLNDVSGSMATVYLQAFSGDTAVGSVRKVRQHEEDGDRMVTVAADGALFDTVRVMEGEGDVSGVASVRADPAGRAAFAAGGEAFLNLGDVRTGVELIFADLDDVSGDTASVHVQGYLRGEAVTPEARLRMPDLWVVDQLPTHRFEGVEIDAVRIADAEGDVSGTVLLSADGL